MSIIHYYYNIAPESSEYTMQLGPIKKSKLCIQGHNMKKFGAFIQLIPILKKCSIICPTIIGSVDMLNNVAVVVLQVLLLIIAGDVELNPGPGKCEL